MPIYKRRHNLEPVKIRVKKTADTFLRCLLLLFLPSLIASVTTLSWYYLFYLPDRNLGDGTKDLIATALLPALGILYGIMLAGVAVDTVWGQYREMRIAVKRYDLDTFIDLRDEDLSPLIHMIVASVSLAMMFGFAAIKYPTAQAGFTIIFSVSFFMALMFIVVMEIDDPCAGLWYIKSIPPEWLDIDPKDYREKRCQKARKEFLERKAVDIGKIRPHSLHNQSHSAR